MADLIRYVNTGSSAGGDGTTNDTTGANRAYVSFSEFETSEQADLVTATNTISVYCSGTLVDSTRVDVTGWTTSATYWVKVYGEFAGTQYSSSYYRLESAQEYNSIVTVSEGYFDFYLMQFSNTATINAPITIDYDVALNNSKNRIERCIHKLVSGVTSGDGSILSSVTATGWHLTVRDVLLYGGRVGVSISYPPANTIADLINVQVHDTSDVGIWAASVATINMYNCLITDTTANAYAIAGTTTFNYSNNVSDDASSPDVGGRNLTITFIDEANDDYSVADTETDVYQQGVGSGTQALVSNDSLNSVARPTSSPDIGAFQIAAAGISSTLNVTEANDSSAITASILNTGTIDVTEANDSSAITASILNTGIIDVTEANDSSAITASVLNTGILNEIEDADTIVSSATVGDVISGILNTSEEDDTSTTTGSVQDQVSGTLVVTESDDVVSTSGSIVNIGTIAVAEANDSSTTSGTLNNFGTLTAIEESDTVTGIGTIGDVINGVLNTSDDDDTVSATGSIQLQVLGTVDQIENDDSIATTGLITLLGILNQTEEADTSDIQGYQGDGLFATADITEEDDISSIEIFVAPEYTTLVSDITTIIDKSTETNISNYNNVTYFTEDNPDTVVTLENSITILSECIQGPAGPPTGLTTAIDNLSFVGSGTGTNKTSTEIIGNIIFEEFGVNDELYVVWTIPLEIDRSKDVYFEGSFFPVIDGTSRTSSWEIHITAHNTTTEYTGVVTATDLSINDIAYTISHGQALIDHTLYLDNNTTTLHIRLKRIASSNDPTRVGVGDLAIMYSTDGRVGEQGPTGPSGSEEDTMYAKRVDFIDDSLLYRGEAVPGTLDSASTWRIRKITIAATDSDVNETWADGNDNFDNIWDNRLSYTYS